MQTNFRRTGGRLATWAIIAGCLLQTSPLEAQTLKLKDTIGGAHEGGIHELTYSADGKTLVSVNDGTVKLWDLATGKNTGVFRLPYHVNHFNPKASFRLAGKTLLGVNNYGQLGRWELDTDKSSSYKTFKGTGLPPALSADSKMLAGVSTDTTIELWDVAGPVLHAKLPKEHAGQIIGLAFSPDGQKLASVSADRTIKLWDVAGKKCLNTLKGHAEPVQRVLFSADGTMLVSVGYKDSDSLKNDGATIVLWDAKTGTKVGKPITGLRELRAVALSPDGKALAWGSDLTPSWAWWQSKGELHLWDVTAGKEKAKYPTTAITALAFRADGAQLAVANSLHAGGHTLGIINLWDVDTGKITASSRPKCAQGEVA